MRKGLLEQLSLLIPGDDCKLPQSVILLDTSECQSVCQQSQVLGVSGSNGGSSSCTGGYTALAAQLTTAGIPVITTSSSADVRAAMQHLTNKLLKFCNSNAKAPGPMKVVITGSDFYINSVLRPYVADFSTRPPDYQNHIRFLIVPLGGVSSLAKYLGSVDAKYGASFVSEWWREAIERWDATDVQEAVSRITNYLNQASHTIHLPIAEAVLTYKEKSSDDESSQTFIPFLTDVRLGSGDVTSTSIDLDDPLLTPASASIAVTSASQTGTQSCNSQPNSSSNLSNLVNLNMLTTSPPSMQSGGTSSTVNTTSAATTSSTGGGYINSSIGSPGSSLVSPQTNASLVAEKNREATTPPSSPNINTTHLPT